MTTQTTIHQSAVTTSLDRLAGRLRGQMIQPGHPEYDQARRVFNGMIDRRPAMIVRCAGVDDVIASVRFAREHAVPLAIRGGGHSGSGLGVCDDGMVIDLSAISVVEADANRRTARVGGGATLCAVDAATQAYGLATPTGIHSTTGAGGLTLGGGIGNLTRKYGLTLDNLLAADVVLADGRLVTASSQQHPDLFWALRGGGGNFGVVTSFLFQLHPVSTVIAGAMLWPLEQAADVMSWYREYLPSAPDDLNGRLGFITVPPIAAFPDHLHFLKMCSITWCYAGLPDSADDLIEPVRRVVPPAFDGIRAMPFTSLQKSVSDAIYPSGLQWYWKTDFFRELPDEAIARHIDFAAGMPTRHSTVQLHPVNGAAGRVETGATAWDHRDANWALVIVGVDPDPANAGPIRQWATDYWQALHPFAAGGAYMNFSMGDDTEGVGTYYGGSYARLSEIKARYDPTNLFRVNQNIQPAR